MTREIHRGEIWSVDLGSDPTDPEQAFIRPAVVVSDDRLHDPRLQMCIIAPGTTTIRRIGLHLVIEPDSTNGLGALTAFQAEQVRAVSVGRLAERLGHIGAIATAQLDELLRTVLAL